MTIKTIKKGIVIEKAKPYRMTILCLGVEKRGIGWIGSHRRFDTIRFWHWGSFGLIMIR
jgi:hypothetical protein